MTIKRYSSLIALFVILASLTLTKEENKQYKKAEKYSRKHDYTMAVTTFSPVLQAHKKEREAWDIYLRYSRNAVGDCHWQFDRVMLGYDLNDLLSSMQCYVRYDFITANKRCMLMCEDYYPAQDTLMHEILDTMYSIDKGVPAKLRERYRDGAWAMERRDYAMAEETFLEVLREMPEYYRARMMLGACYYLQGKMGKAINELNEASTSKTKMPDACLWLTDVYIAQNRLNEARETCVEGIMRFPSAALFNRLQKIDSALGHKFDRHWVSRDYAINTWKLKSDKAPTDLVWKPYRQSLDRIRPYCDSSDIIVRPNDYTTSKYMEVYGWEQLLRYNKSPEFDIARKMQAKGFLDCYVLISMFHADLYRQQQHLVRANPDKVKQYLEMLRGEI